MAQTAEPVLSELLKIFLQDDILTDSDEKKNWATDWSKTNGDALFIVFPRTTEQVSLLMAFCSQNQITVVPSGGRTGLVGGAVSTDSQIVLSLTKMNRIGEVDKLSRTLPVEAGAITEAVHEKCKLHDLTWPIDLASKGSCTIGGNLSTNAGGLQVIQFGMARRWVTSLTVVLSDGEVLELNHGLEKNNTGYSLIQLLIGSEGTLGVIVKATLKLISVSNKTLTWFSSFNNLSEVHQFITDARSLPWDLQACEFFSKACLDQVKRALSLETPIKKEAQYFIICDLHVAESEFSESDKIFEILQNRKFVENVITNDSQKMRAIWALREGITESIGQRGAVRKYDVCVPVNKMSVFLDEIVELTNSKSLPFELFLFGHYGDGSPHLNFSIKPGTSAESFNSTLNQFEIDKIFPLVKKFHGSISSEHGIGLLKKDWVRFSKSNRELEILRGIKNVFDPAHILNPGKLIP